MCLVWFQIGGLAVLLAFHLAVWPTHHLLKLVEGYYRFLSNYYVCCFTLTVKKPQSQLSFKVGRVI